MTEGDPREFEIERDFVRGVRILLYAQAGQPESHFAHRVERTADVIERIGGGELKLVHGSPLLEREQASPSSPECSPVDGRSGDLSE